MSGKSNHNDTSKAILTSEYKTLLVHGYPTKTFAVDFVKPPTAGATQGSTRVFPHTVLVFIPGNPGLVDWYLRSFESIVDRLGPGFAARGVANAGHGFEPEHAQIPNNDKSLASIAHSVDGQSIHKAYYLHLLAKEFNDWQKSKDHTSRSSHILAPEWVFVSHSVGCHFIQRACILQPCILKRTRLFLHLTPFLRMSAPDHKQWLLDTVASNDRLAIAFGQSVMSFLKRLPKWLVNRSVQLSIRDEACRKTTVSLIRQPLMASNFFLLGLQEIRDLPELFDVRFYNPRSMIQLQRHLNKYDRFQLASMRIVAKHCHCCFLVAGDDHWFPESLIRELNTLIERKHVTKVSVYYDQGLKHGYVLQPESSEQVVVDFCVDRILESSIGTTKL